MWRGEVCGLESSKFNVPSLCEGISVMEIWADDVFFFDEFNLERTKTINEKTHIILKCSNHLSLVQNFNNNHNKTQLNHFTKFRSSVLCLYFPVVCLHFFQTITKHLPYL